jgi:hypothetical protein
VAMSWEKCRSCEMRRDITDTLFMSRGVVYVCRITRETLEVTSCVNDEVPAAPVAAGGKCPPHEKLVEHTSFADGGTGTRRFFCLDCGAEIVQHT